MQTRICTQYENFETELCKHFRACALKPFSLHFFNPSFGAHKPGRKIAEAASVPPGPQGPFPGPTGPHFLVLQVSNFGISLCLAINCPIVGVSFLVFASPTLLATFLCAVLSVSGVSDAYLLTLKSRKKLARICAVGPQKTKRCWSFGAGYDPAGILKIFFTAVRFFGPSTICFCNRFMLV